MRCRRELLEDLSLGKSWLYFRREADAIEVAPPDEPRREKKKYTGKTYDSVDSIADFFKQRNRQMGHTPEPKPKPASASSGSSSSAEFTPGSYVRSLQNTAAASCSVEKEQARPLN